ncbi:MAG: hypothetical protein Q7R48_02935, partial [bacterium]|nr:hypothetical protein [bacterium]
NAGAGGAQLIASGLDIAHAFVDKPTVFIVQQEISFSATQTYDPSNRVVKYSLDMTTTASFLQVTPNVGGDVMKRPDGTFLTNPGQSSWWGNALAPLPGDGSINLRLDSNSNLVDAVGDLNRITINFGDDGFISTQ